MFQHPFLPDINPWETKENAGGNGYWCLRNGFWWITSSALCSPQEIKDFCSLLVSPWDGVSSSRAPVERAQQEVDTRMHFSKSYAILIGVTISLNLNRRLKKFQVFWEYIEYSNTGTQDNHGSELNVSLTFFWCARDPTLAFQCLVVCSTR
jgi:hypothetical protein